MIFRWSPDEGVPPGFQHVVTTHRARPWGWEAWPGVRLLLHPSLHTPQRGLCLLVFLKVPCLPSSLCRHTMLYCALVYCGLQILCVLELKVCGNPTLSRPVGTSFQTFAHFASLCYILVILTMFQNFHHYLLWCSVISDLWCYYDLLKAHMTFSIF